MSTTTEERLRHLGDHLIGDSAPVTLDEIRGHARMTTPEPTPVLVTTGHESSAGRRRWVSIVVLAAVAAAVVGVLVVNRMAPTPPTSNADSTSDGRLILDPPPDGWSMTAAADQRQAAGSDVFISRMYALDGDRPEQGPAIEVQSFDADAGSPYIAGAVTAINVNEVHGSMYDDEQSRRTIAFERDGQWFILAAHQLSDTELVIAAQYTVLDPGGYGAVIEPPGLPQDVVERSAGIRDADWFLSRASLVSSVPRIDWRNGDQALWLQSLDDPEAAVVEQIWAASVDHAVIHGQPASLFTIAGRPGFQGIAWAEHGRTFLLGSHGISSDDLVTYANELRPASSDEWAAMIAVTQPPAASIDPATGLPAPGGLVPTGVNHFPTIAETAVPDQGQGITYAYYSYYSPGIDTVGTSWQGAIGHAGSLDGHDAVLVTVSDPESVEQLPVVEGRTPDVGEYTYGEGAELVVTTDGYAVVLQGTDVDLLYKLLDHVRPLVDDDGLVGYTLIEPLPNGLTQIAPPFERGFATGAFPTVAVHNGALTMSVNPTPVLNLALSWMSPLETVNTKFGGGYLYQGPGDHSGLFVDLDDATTLILQSSTLDSDELLAMVDAVQLTNESLWRQQYNPRLAVIPRNMNDGSGPPSLPVDALSAEQRTSAERLWD